MSCSKLVSKLQKFLQIYNLSFACGNIPPPCRGEYKVMEM